MWNFWIRGSSYVCRMTLWSTPWEKWRKHLKCHSAACIGITSLHGITSLVPLFDYTVQQTVGNTFGPHLMASCWQQFCIACYWLAIVLDRSLLASCWWQFWIACFCQAVGNCFRLHLFGKLLAWQPIGPHLFGKLLVTIYDSTLWQLFWIASIWQAVGDSFGPPPFGR